jgi:meiotic recombination protein SPO11
MSDQKRRRKPDPSASTSKKPRGSSSSSYAQDLRKKLKPDDDILAALRHLSATTSAAASSKKPLSISDLNLTSSCREVTDLNSSSVLLSIECLILSVARSILSGQGFSFDVPSRASSNQLYVPELDRIVLLDKSSSRPFANLSTVRKVN